MAAEKLLRDDGGSRLRDYVVVRPSFLTEGKALGGEKVRVGWMWNGEKRGMEKEQGGSVGWTVSKRDLGAWVAQNVLKGGEEEKSGWERKVVKVTY